MAQRRGPSNPRGAGAMDFDTELGKLPQDVADHIRGAGLADAAPVADSAAPSALLDAEGKTVHRTVGPVFVEAIP